MAVHVHPGWDTIRPFVPESPFPQTAFGIELDATIKCAGLSYFRASKKIGVGQGCLSRLVSGERRPTRDMVDRIVFGLDLCNADRQRLYVFAGYVPFDLVSVLIDAIDREG